MLIKSYANFAGSSPAISAQFTLKMCVAAGIRKKSLKPPILRFKVVQGHRR